ncbi:MAG: hypothetical protein EOR00_24240 [Mesorhizobium sp.]|uniref:hypothetical protein n=1 Tax=Mesorhizobium sp. TaxID=1871066 RepID=UPI000FE52BB3|nr:hypothetical protein [Mesorhizobium sp.]RWP13954.1 MAG: hypothetical protein EOR00_24240 [Mesorhizobium sp.]
MEFSSRIRTRAAGLLNGNKLLEIASREDVHQEMLRRIRLGEKPVTALSQPLIEAIGLEAARDDNLRRLSGEVAAAVVEKEHGCQRTSGSKVINGDPVYTTGQPFREAPERVPAVSGAAPGEHDLPISAVLVRLLGNDTLVALDQLVDEELQRRAA